MKAPGGVIPVRTIQDLSKYPYPDVSQNQECIVCIEPLRYGEEVALLPCSHTFHSHCIEPWIAQHLTCPSCNQQVLMPLATPLEATLQPTLDNPHNPTSGPFLNCRDCNRQYHVDPHVNPSTRAYFRCPHCREHPPNVKDFLKASCAIS